LKSRSVFKKPNNLLQKKEEPGMKIIKNLINGQWVDSSSGATARTCNPANTAEEIALVPLATLQDAQSAIAAANEAFPKWAQTPPPQRGAILDKAGGIIDARLDEMARALTMEEGKTLAEARGEVMRARDIFKYFGGEGWRMGGQVLPNNTPNELLYSRREPLGVVTIITPWNFPIAIPAWKIAPALVYGNAVVFKPAFQTPLIASLLVQALVDAGLPAGVLNFITGRGAQIGDEIVSSPQIQGISFTGSYAIGTGIYAKAIPNLTRVQLEMGGKNPMVVLNDADLGLAVRLAVSGGFGLTGQACTATSRVIVEDGIADAYVEALGQAARAMKVGYGLEADVQMGPASSQSQLETDLHYIDVGKSEGAQLVAGGGQTRDNGYFVLPTVFDRVEAGMTIAQEEIFGPVISVLRARDFEDALEKANGIAFGLSAGVVTRDLNRAMSFAERIQAGVVKINEPTTGLALQAPFGGFKHSSANTFKEQGPAAVEFYTRTKTVYVGYPK
jgi:alpha-ketoglutaric semialdehyde dehydrogenase